MTASVTIRAEWDMGHRLPNHGGQCRNLHGHRYAAEITAEGPVREDAGHSDDGMVVDFSQLKAAVRAVVDGLDHRFLVHAGDPHADALAALPGVTVVPFVPTAERLAVQLLDAIGAEVSTRVLRVRIRRLRLFETPTSWADAEGL